MCRWMRLAPAVGLMVVGVGTAPAADTLESAEAAIVALCQKIHAVQFKIESTQNVETPTYKAISHTQGTFELLKKGDKPLYRMETHTRASRIEKGKEEKYEATTTTVGDGEFQWAFTDSPDSRSVVKSRLPEQVTFVADKAFFDALHRENDVRLLPDETVDGRAAYVIEAASKQPTAGTVARLLMYFDKATGVGLKSIGLDDTGKTLQISTNTDIKVNGELSPERFVFKAPAGVPVTDLTQTQPTPGPARETAPPPATTQPAPEPAQKPQDTKPPKKPGK